MQGTGGFLNPQKVLSQIELPSPAKIADFGCGHGYFAIPLAKTIGKDSKIYAIDILNDALDEIKSKSTQEGLYNIETIRGNLEVPKGSTLPDNFCDVVLLANILFQSKKKADIIKEAKRVLRFNGKLVIIDWQPTGAVLTSDSGWRISPAEAQRLAEEEKFSLERTFDAGAYHYGLIFNKTD